jgi:NADH dehydrogenase (ubiquinone) Fe-S protein 5
VKELTQAYRKWEAQNPNLQKKTAGEIRSLGLIDASMEEMNLKAPKWLPHVKRN